MSSDNSDDEYEKDVLEATRAVEAEFPNSIVDERIEKIDPEWVSALYGFESKGPLIGGALRDRLNNRHVTDVDIFLPSEGSARRNRNFIRKAFKNASITIMPQRIYHYAGYTDQELPDPKNMALMQPPAHTATNAESWLVLGGPGKTPYNIVFFDGPVAALLKRDAESALRDGPFAKNALNLVDIGLCAIATDGRHIETTPGYDNDIAHNTITLVRPHLQAAERLARVSAKYPSWKIVRP